MSSEFLENIDSDSNGCIVSLEMNSSGCAFLHAGDFEGRVFYCLEPNETGWGNAEKIISALKGWIEHTKELQEFKNNYSDL